MFDCPKFHSGRHPLHAPSSAIPWIQEKLSQEAISKRRSFSKDASWLGTLLRRLGGPKEVATSCCMAFSSTAFHPHYPTTEAGQFLRHHERPSHSRLLACRLACAEPWRVRMGKVETFSAETCSNKNVLQTWNTHERGALMSTTMHTSVMAAGRMGRIFPLKWIFLCSYGRLKLQAGTLNA